MPTFSTDDLRLLSRLARLELTVEEEERFAVQLSSVVAYVDQLAIVDTSSVGEVRGVSGLSNVLAADLPRPEGDPLHVTRESLLAQVPQHRNGLIRVRAVLAEGV